MYWAEEMVPKRKNGQAVNRRLTILKESSNAYSKQFATKA